MSGLTNTTVGANPKAKAQCATTQAQFCAPDGAPVVLTEAEILQFFIDNGITLPNGDVPTALWQVEVTLHHKNTDAKDWSTGAEVEYTSTTADACAGLNGINTDMDPGGVREYGGGTDDCDDPVPLTGLEITIEPGSCVLLNASAIVPAGSAKREAAEPATEESVGKEPATEDPTTP